MDPPDIFVSYSREDIRTAAKFADGLRKAGFSVWWDQAIKSGETYDEVTENALRTAKAVVVLWSPRSVKSRWVRSEATIANRQHTLIPVMIEPCERPVMFELNQAIDLTSWKGNLKDKAWLTLVNDIRGQIAGDSGPSADAPPSQPVGLPFLTSVTARWKSIGLAAVLSAAIGGGYVYFGQSAAAQSSRTVVFAIDAPATDTTARQLAEAARQDIFTQLNAVSIETLARSQTDNISAAQQAQLAKQLNVDYAVRGKIVPSNGRYAINLTIEDTRTGENLWEKTISEEDADQNQLVIRAGDSVSEVLKCYQNEGSHLLTGAKPERETLKKFCTYEHRTDPHAGFLQNARELSKVSDDGAPIHLTLAMNLIGALNFGSKEESAAAYSEIMALAEKLERTKDGKYGAALIMAEIAQFKGEPLAKQMTLFEMAARSSAVSFAKKEYAVRLAEVGRIREATDVARLAAKLGASNPGNSRLHARLLAVNGQISQSNTITKYSLDRYATPQSWEFAVVQSVLLGSGNSAELLEARPRTISDETYRCMKDFAVGAKVSNQYIFDCEGVMTYSSYELIYVWSQNESKAILEFYNKYANRKNSPAFGMELFYSNKAKFVRQDPGLLTFFAKMGYVDYWKESKTLPDVCYSPDEEKGEFCTNLRRLTGQTD